MNEYDSVQPAYENGPKEVNVKRGMHDGNKQFGKNKMPQDEKSIVKSKPVITYKRRHMEHR